MRETLGEYLKRIRKEKGLTLRGVEDKTKISNAYLSQIENGKITQPSPSVLYKLAELFSVTYESLMQLAGYPIAPANENSLMFRTSQRLEKITEEEEKELLAYLDFLRSRRLQK